MYIIHHARGQQEEGEGFRVVPSPCAVGFEPPSSSRKSAERFELCSTPADEDAARHAAGQQPIDLANESSDSSAGHGDSESRCQPIIGMVRSEPQTAAPGTLNKLSPTKRGTLNLTRNLNPNPNPNPIPNPNPNPNP